MLASGLFRFTNSFYLWNWMLPFERVPERDDVRAPVMFIDNVSEKPGCRYHSP
jgi:hypothetical protein